MGNCLSRQTRRERQDAARSSHQLYSISISSAMLDCHDKLVTAIATDYLTIAGALFTHRFISEEVYAKMLLPSSTPNEKATVLVAAIRERMKLAPQHFSELVKILSEHTSTECIVSSLQSAYQVNLRSTRAGDIAMPDQFRSYLKALYGSLTPTQSSADTWPPSSTRKVINLAMIKSTVVRRGQIQDRFVRQTITGKIDDIMREKYPVEVKDIFNETEGKRKVVLLEGAPGCGKSTLSVYISQQWGEGKLFTEFNYAILVRLRDPAVQAASCIADLIPAKDDEMRQQAASEFYANNGHGVLFILDGWDELPFSLHNHSIFHEIIQPSLILSQQNNPLLNSAVIVTSRPIASSDLHPLVSSRIEILGFTPEELNNYFAECLEGNTKAVETLLERIDENPAIAGSCYLPMNASILVHLFKSDNNSLPTTQYGIFSELVLSCIYRHYHERSQLKNLTLESLQQIPEALKESFLFLCELACQGIMYDRIIFPDLPANVNTLGLIQGVESFVRRGKAVSFNFLHLSIQELLAGFYIATQLPHDEQISKFKELTGNSRFTAVFEFYAAITKLKTPGIKDVIIKAVIEYKCNQNAEIYFDNTQMISLIHCLHEAQDPSMSQSVAQQLEHRLEISSASLTPLDCLCIGCFLSHICLMDADKFEANLSSCNISDQGCKYLASGLCKNRDPGNAVTTPLTLNMSNNPITHYGLGLLLSVDCIEKLLYFKYNYGRHAESLQGTCVFVDQLKNNTTLKRLSLCGCGLTPHNIKDLAEALTTNKHLEELDISENVLDDGCIECLAHTLNVNQCLKKLHVRKCSITILNKSLTDALANSKHLEELDISENELGDGCIKYLAHILNVSQCLKKLHVRSCSITILSSTFIKALANGKHLEELNISDNPIRDDGIQHLAHALSANQGLKELYLQNCNITSLSESFAEALATNEHLEVLDISGNKLRDDGIQHLACAVRINQNLKKLSLKYCSLTSLGAKSLAEMLTINKHLEGLDISDNELGNDGIQYLGHALQVNQQLKSLKLCGCEEITEFGFKYLVKCLQENHSLTDLEIPYQFQSTSSVDIEKTVNDIRSARMRNGLPLISVTFRN